MAADETTICNQALGRLGEARIMSLMDDSQPARFCKLFYSQTRDEVLRDHAWNFATKRVTLSQLSEEPVFGWAHQYELPTDFVRLIQLNGWEAYEQPDNWEIEGSRLLTDEESAEIKYVYRAEDANLFDALFIEALAVKLAAKLVTPLTGSRSQAAELLREYEVMVLPKAKRHDASERRAKRKLLWVESDLVRSRGGC